MLGHHADAQSDRVPGRMDGDALAVDQDVPLVGMVQAVEDAHQGRLARAVFAQQGMDLPVAQSKFTPLLATSEPKRLWMLGISMARGMGSAECRVLSVR